MSDLFIHATVGEHLSCFDCHHNAVTSVLGTYSLVLCACISPGLYLKEELLGQRMHMSSPLLALANALANDFPSGCLPLALSLLHNCSSYAAGRKPEVQNCWSQEML